MRVRKNLPRYRSRAAVAAACLVVIGLMWAGVMVALQTDRTLAIESRHRENGNLTRVFAENVTRTIRAADITLDQMVSEYQRRGKAFDLVEYARMGSLYLDPATLLSISDETGELILANIPPPAPVNFSRNSNHQYHTKHDTPGIFISEPRLGTTTQKWTVYLSRRINKADGSFGGITVYGLDPAYLAKLYTAIDLGADSVFNLIGRDGIMRAREDISKFSAGQDLSQSKLFTQDLPAADHGGFIRESTVDQVPRISSYRALTDYPLVVAIGTSLQVALAPYEARKSQYLEAAGTVTAIILGFGLFAVRMIGRNQRANEGLRQSETRLAEAQKTAHLGSWDLDLVSNHLVWSDEIYRIFEIDPARFGASYEAFLNAVHPDDLAVIDKAYTDSVAAHTPHQTLHRLLMPDGRIKWVEQRGQTWYDDAGRPLRSAGTAQDITEKVLAEQQLRRSIAEKDTLLREIHHRVKNNLQIIASLLYFQARKVKDPDDLAAFTDGRERLRAMILVHEKLYQSAELTRIDFGGYLRSLVRQLAESQPHQDQRITTRVEADDDALPLEVAQPCGMIVCELLLNAFKYAFPDARHGEIAVRAVNTDGRMTVTVSDNGVGLPADFDTKSAGSFGWQLINALVTQIDGTIAATSGAGTTVTVSFPLPEAVQ
jgi:PAS domain S-box-containing protein